MTNLLNPAPNPWPLSTTHLMRITALGGSALPVAVLLMSLAAETGQDSFKLPPAPSAKKLGCSPHTIKRGIKALEAAGYVRVRRSAPKVNVVTLLPFLPSGA